MSSIIIQNPRSFIYPEYGSNKAAVMQYGKTSCNWELGLLKYLKYDCIGMGHIRSQECMHIHF